MRRAWPLLLLLGCPADPPVVDPPPAIGVDVRVPSQGEVRAGIAPAERFDEAAFGGIDAEGRPGDVLLYNDLVRFVIQGARAGHGYVDSPGAIIDADIVRDGQPGRDVIEELFLSFGLGWLTSATEVTVVADGTDGPGIVRATGRAVPWRFLMGVTGTDEPITEDPGVTVTMEYELRPGERCVRVRATMVNDVDYATRFNPTDGWIASGEDLRPWAADRGLLATGDDVEALGAVGLLGEVAFSVWNPDGLMEPLGISEIAASVGIVLNTNGWRDAEPGAEFVLNRRLCVGPDPASVEAARYAELGVATTAVEGVVTSGGAPLPGARVHFVDGERVGPYAITDADGRYAAQLPAGDWTAWAVASGARDRVDLPATAGRMSAYTGVPERTLASLRGEGTPFPFATGRLVPAGAAPADIDLPEPATLVLRLRDDAGEPIPGYVAGAWAEPLAHAVPPELLEPLGLDGSEAEGLRLWTGDGDVELQLPPGTLALDASHSWRHERAQGEAVLVAGETTTVELVLAEVVPADDWRPLDGHLHASPSNDADLTMEERLIGCAASGVELPVATDHDRQADYTSLVEPLGLAGRLVAIPGNESSSELRGHANVIGATFDPDAPNGGAVAWWLGHESTTAQYDDARAQSPGSVVSANHPRDGLFSNADYDPTTGTGREGIWTWGFDAFELVNSTGSGDLDELREDWFSFLDFGYRKTPMGVSDSHGLGRPCGYGRTDVLLGDLADVTPAAVTDALRAGHVVVAQGVTLRATMGDALPGDVAPLAPLQVSAQAPSWIRPETLRVWKNGDVVHTEALGEPAGVTVFDVVIEVEADADAWIVVEVLGGPSMGGVASSARPYAVANAFFVDTDGDGWSAPVD